MQIGVLIAVLRKSFNIALTTEQIFEGIRIAKQIGVDEAIAREAGDESTNEAAVVRIDKVATDGAGTYAEICNWTVTAGKTGVLAKIEMASADYTNVQFRLTVAGKIVFEDKELPSATTITLSDLSIRGGKVTKIEAKSTDATAHNVWGDISGKEII